MSTPVTGPLTPYVTPAGGLLQSWPTGVDFGTIPPDSTTTQAQKTAAVMNLCASATVQAEEYVNQPLRATLATETMSGPDYRVTVENSTGNVRCILARWPVTSITAVSVSPNVFPRTWRALPAGNWDIERPIIGAYGTNAPTGSGEGGQSVIIAPFASWGGRNSWRIRITYTHGWPHTSLTAAPAAGDTTVTVDDCTAWAPVTTGAFGALGVVYDGGGQETCQVTAASATAGPGTLTLATGLSYGHTAGVMCSAMPVNVIWGSALFAAADALTRGATSTTVRSLPGHSGGPSGAEELRVEAMLKLHPYRVTI